METIFGWTFLTPHSPSPLVTKARPRQPLSKASIKAWREGAIWKHIVSSHIETAGNWKIPIE